MDVDVSLFGEEKRVYSWLNLLEQERVPFTYQGKRLTHPSEVNILIDIPENEIKKFIESGKNRVFITDPNPSREKLTDAFKTLDIPYIHFWYYPFPKRSVFLFRIDVDFVDQKGLENLSKVTKEFNIRGTYFVNISGDEEFDEEPDFIPLEIPTTPKRKEILIKLLAEGNELANHGFRHIVYKAFKNNYKNIKRCNRYLDRLLKVKCLGFASPGAEWNENLAEAIDKNNLLYSSCGLKDVGFPYKPSFGEKRSKSFEIPCHYFCDASFDSPDKFGAKDRWVLTNRNQKELHKSYFKYIKERLKNSEPIGLLGHPHIIGKSAVDFYPKIFKEIKRLSIPALTLGEFAKWWKERENFQLEYNMRGDLIEVRTSYPALVEMIFRGKRKIIKVEKMKVLKI